MAMDPTKKRKLDENGFNGGIDADHLKLSTAEARKMIVRFTSDQLIDIVQDALVRHPDVLASVRAVADPDVAQRKLFIRGLGWDTTTDGLRSLFSAYGELEEAVVILDKVTGKSKGYGFVTFRHVDGALLALREPSKRIDGRVTVTQLAAAGNTGTNTNSADIALRKIYVANVPPDLPGDKLLAHFSLYGEIEEGPLGFDKQTGKSKGFALFVYKTPEGAQAALLDPMKTVEGRQLNCKLAIDGKQGKRNGAGPEAAQGHGNAHSHHGDGMGMAPGGAAGSGPGSLSGQYGGPGGLGSYGGFASGGLQGQPPLGNHPMNSSVGGLGNQANQSSIGGAGTYGGAGLGGHHYGGYGGPGSTGFGGLGGAAATGAGGFGGGAGGAGPAAGAGAAGGHGGPSGAGSLYRLPSSAGMQAGGYPESGHYSLSGPSGGYQNQHHPPTGASPAPRIPHGSMYPNAHPYY